MDRGRADQHEVQGGTNRGGATSSVVTASSREGVEASPMASLSAISVNFILVHATPLRLVALERGVILDAGLSMLG